MTAAGTRLTDLASPLEGRAMTKPRKPIPKLVPGMELDLNEFPDLVVLELHGCRDPVSGAITPWAEALCRRAWTYTSVMADGRGLQLIGLAPDLPAINTTLPRGKGQWIRILKSGPVAVGGLQ